MTTSGANDTTPSEPDDILSDAQPKRQNSASGVHEAPSLAARVQAALAASARSEAALADIARTTKFLSATIGTLRTSNAVLAHELQSLTKIASSVERVGLAGRVELLEQVLSEAGQDCARERARLVLEHDKFITMLIADHEREVSAMRKRLAEVESNAKIEPDDEHAFALLPRGSDSGN
jgi:hypothetical protein